MTDLEIIHETNNYIVVNKKAGRISEKSPYESNTVEDQVFQYLLKNIKKPYVGVVHRLDRVTSGVLIFAKKKSILAELNLLFSSRKVQKTYLAIVSSKPPKNKGTLINFLVKNNHEKKAEIVPTKTKNSQDCRLTYEVIGQNKFGYLLKINPTTGRFHQIRAQLSHLGLPIIGDKKYGSEQEYFPLSIGLHALKIAYKIQDSDELTVFEAKMPNNPFWKFEDIISTNKI